MAVLWEQLDEYTKLNVDNATGTMKVCGYLYFVLLSVIFSSHFFVGVPSLLLEFRCKCIRHLVIT